jgi:hypothetical protein
VLSGAPIFYQGAIQESRQAVNGRDEHARVTTAAQEYWNKTPDQHTVRWALIRLHQRRIVMAELESGKRNDLSKGDFAFPKQRKEPLENASHVRNAVARFDQVEGVNDDERNEAWKRIKAAAKKYNVEIKEESWRELGKKGSK